MPANSIVQYIGNGTAGPYSVPFPYLSKAHIFIRVNDVLIPPETGYTWPTGSTIQFTAGNFPAVATNIDIRRASNIDARLVDYTDGSTLGEVLMDKDANQLMYLAQEARDIATGAMNLSLSDMNWDARGVRIKNVGAPMDPNDAARLVDVTNTRTYVDAQIAARTGMLPLMTGHAGQYLKTDGAVAAWADASAIGAGYNAVTNGDCQINQINSSGQTSGIVVTAPANADYTSADMWLLDGQRGFSTYVPAFEGTFQDHPDLGSRGWCRRWTMAATPANLTAGEYLFFTNKIEQTKVAALVGSPDLEMSFKVKSSKTGEHYVRLSTVGMTHIIYNYNVPVANVWQKVTMPITLPVTIGDLANCIQGASTASGSLGTGVGLDVQFPLVCGTTGKLPNATNLNVWRPNTPGAEEYVGPNFTNFWGTADFRVTDLCMGFTGIGLRFPRQNFDIALRECQRYYWQTFPYGTKPAQGSTSQGALVYHAHASGVSTDGVLVQCPVRMRTLPQVLFFNSHVAGTTWRNRTLNLDSGAPGVVGDSGQGVERIYISNPQVAGDLIGHQFALHMTVNANLIHT